MTDKKGNAARPSTAWRLFERRDWPVRVRYPDPTPGGCSVQINERSLETGSRFHFTSPGSDELYFEIGRVVGRSRSEAIADFLSDVTARFAGLTVGETEAVEIGGAAGLCFEIAWPGKRRRIHFVEKEARLFRIILNPESELNHKVLATLEFA